MKKPLLFIVIMTFIGACQPQVPSAPWCRVAETEPTIEISQEEPQSAACIVRFNNELLVLQNSAEQYLLAITPATNEESLQCAAHRGIWQSYGFNVEVGTVLGNYQGTRYFDCVAPTNTLPDKRPYDAPRWGIAAEHKVTTVEPEQLSKEKWQTKSDAAAIQALFN